jgi:DNA-binding CsgD family transcriptional regulator/tetratricopeptide (TPR) repeat protein
MSRPGSGRFVGREEELRTCSRALDDVEQGGPQTVLVLGEPGLGKSRLSSAVASLVRERGGLVLTSHGLSLDGGELPYSLVSELLQDLARQLGGPHLTAVLADGLEALGPLARPAASVSGKVDRVSVFAAVVELLRRLAEERPVCWWVEDLQWSDQSSRDIARYVSRVAEGCRLLLLATIRTDAGGEPPRELDELVGDPGVVVLRLDPLGAVHVRELVAELMVDGDRSSETRERIVALSDGIPFFVEELSRAPEGGLPSSLRGIVTRRLDDLSPAGKALVGAVATSSGPATFAALAALGAAPEVAADPSAGLAECLDRGILELGRADDVVRFRHALLTEAVLDYLLPQERQEWHRRWGLYLDERLSLGQGTPETLFHRAHHWYEARDASAAVRAAVEAARAGEASEAYAELAHLWGHAHELWLAAGPAVQALGVTHHDVATEWFRTTYRAGDPGAYRVCIDSVGRSPDLARDPLVEDFLQVADRVRRVMSDLPPLPVMAGHEPMDIARRLTEAPVTLMAATTALLLVEMETLDGSLEVAERLVGVLESLAESGENDDLRIRAYLRLAMVTSAQNDRAATLRHLRVGFERALSTQSSIRAMAATDLAIELWRQGRAHEALEVMRVVARSLPDDVALVSSTWSFFLLGYVALLSETGHWEEALRWAVTLRQSTGVALTAASAQSYEAQILVRQGRLDEARRLFVEEAPDDELSLDLALVNVAPMLELAAQTGDADQARVQLSRVLAHPPNNMRRAEVLQIVLVAARFLLDRSIGDVRADDLRAIKEFAEPMVNGTPLVDAHSAEIAALVGDLSGNSDVSTWRAVVDGWDAIGQPYDVACARLRLAAHLMAADDRRSATEQLSAVQEIAASLPSPWLADQALLVGRVHGLRLRSAAPVASGAGPLTGRELEVLGLLTTGLSNQEIGERLFMSPRTASVHVSRIITKLGVRNRTEAATLAQRSGLVPILAAPDPDAPS